MRTRAPGILLRRAGYCEQIKGASCCVRSFIHCSPKTKQLKTKKNPYSTKKKGKNRLTTAWAVLFKACQGAGRFAKVDHNVRRTGHYEEGLACVLNVGDRKIDVAARRSMWRTRHEISKRYTATSGSTQSGRSSVWCQQHIRRSQQRSFKEYASTRNP